MLRLWFVWLALCCVGCATTTPPPKSYPLHAAAAAFNVRQSKYLVEVKHINVNSLNADNKTPLEVAYDQLGIYGFDHPENLPMAEEVRYLRSMGADANHGDVLSQAAYDGNMDLVPLLVQGKNGANTNKYSPKGFTPLHYAAICDFRLSCDDCSSSGNWKAGAKPTIDYLIHHHADITACSKDGRSVLDMVPTPCPPNNPNCKELADKVWPSGSCRETYYYVKAQMEASLKKKCGDPKKCGCKKPTSTGK